MKFVRFVVFGAVGLIGLGSILFTAAGIALPVSASKTQITNQKPYTDLIGREFRVTGNVSALAWNDFPNKETILEISLMSPPLIQNRFVSYTKRLRIGQTVRIDSAWRLATLSGYAYQYRVALPGSELPEGIPITLSVNSDGILDPRVYEPIDK